MDILFMGTPDFACVSLEYLINSTHRVVGVVCQNDKPKGRGMEISTPPTKELAQTLNIPVYQPLSLKNNELQEVLDFLKPELIVVVAYGKILPKYILDYPKYGCINVHGSLLPKYRGSAPIQWAVINGEKVSGVTTMYMAEGMDTGDILETAQTNISETETAGELYDRLKVAGAELLISTISKIENNNLTPIPQDDSLASYAPMLNKELGRIDFTKSAKDIVNLIRGLNPWPVAYTEINKGILKIYEGSVREIHSNAEIGTILECDDTLIVQTREFAVELKSVQLQGKKRMDIKDFLRGSTFIKNTKL